MKYVGVDWAYRAAQWCALGGGGEIVGEGRIAADREGLARFVLELGNDVKACLEMMSGALWVRDQLVASGWQVEVADARKVKTVAPLAAKTDKIDARLLAELCRRGLVPALWLPSLDERALRERLRRRMHLVRLRTSAKARIAGLQTQWGIRISLHRLRRADGMALLERAGMPAVWRRSVSECLSVIDFLDARLEPLDRELKPFAHADTRAVLLDTIPGIAELLALTIAVEIGDISRSAGPEKLVSYGRLAPRVLQSGQTRPRSGPLSKSGSRLLSWAAVEA
jgi:transposase